MNREKSNREKQATLKSEYMHKQHLTQIKCKEEKKKFELGL